MESLIEVEAISKKFCRDLKKSLRYGVKDIFGEIWGSKNADKAKLRRDEFWALKDVSFKVKRGECIGLIGPNGSGKSTMLKMIAGLIKPDAGRIMVKGRIGSLIELGAGFNPVLTGRENIFINAAVLGIGIKETKRKLEAIIEFSGIREFIDTPVRSYSNGMKVRLGFAIASQMNPDVLLVDEVLAVGDIGFRQKCHNVILELSQKCAVILVSHQMSAIARLSTHILLFNRGETIFLGKDVSKGIEYYYNQFEEESMKSIGTDRIKLHRCDIHGNNENGKAIQYLDDVVVNVEFSFQQDVFADVLFLDFFDYSEVFIAETYVFIPDEIKNKKGTNRLVIKIPRVQLKSGRYQLVIMFCKIINGVLKGEFIAQYRPAASFQMTGSHMSTGAPLIFESSLQKSFTGC